MAMKCIHLDCGRKYFSAAEIKQLITLGAEAGFNAMELAFGNDGFRFLLKDMAVGGFSDGVVRQAIHEGNCYYDAHPKFGPVYETDIDELTEQEMDEIISYAAERGMEIIPLLETPGHMHTLLKAMECLGFQNVRYLLAGEKASYGTVDIKNRKALAFLRELILKYAEYFAARGSHWFNMGVDEYANDFAVNDEWVMGINQLVGEGDYPLLVDYLNSLCQVVKEAGLRPMAFNDCVYYGSDESLRVDEDLAVAYWTSGWRGYQVAPAKLIADKGHPLMNCHGDYYWVINEKGSKCSPDMALQFCIQDFPGDYRAEKPAGAIFCIWADGPGYMTGEETLRQVESTIAAFGQALSK